MLGFIIGPAIGAIAELDFAEGDVRGDRGTDRSRRALRSLVPGGRAGGATARGASSHPENGGFFAALWLVLVPSLFLGVIDLLVPLSLDDADWSTIAIAATFIVAALSEVILAPLIGGFSDRRGRLVPSGRALLLVVVTGLAFAALDTPYAIAVLVIVASIAAALIFSPSAALISDRGEEARSRRRWRSGS